MIKKDTLSQLNYFVSKLAKYEMILRMVDMVNLHQDFKWFVGGIVHQYKFPMEEENRLSFL